MVRQNAISMKTAARVEVDEAQPLTEECIVPLSRYLWKVPGWKPRSAAPEVVRYAVRRNGDARGTTWLRWLAQGARIP
jgi:hypothetical protein